MCVWGVGEGLYLVYSELERQSHCRPNEFHPIGISQLSPYEINMAISATARIGIERERIDRLIIDQDSAAPVISSSVNLSSKQLL